MFVLQTDKPETYDVCQAVEEAAIIVSSKTDPACKCTITLTSPIMRDLNVSEGGKISSYVLSTSPSSRVA